MNYLELLERIKKTLPDRRKTKKLARKIREKGLIEKKICMQVFLLEIYGIPLR